MVDAPVVDAPVTDAAVDAPADAMLDASPDSMLMPDAMVDAGADARVDAMPDAMVDAAADAMVDAAPDAPVAPFMGAMPIGLAQDPLVIDDDPTLTADLLELYFNRLGDVYVARRTAVGAAFSTPVRVNEVSSASDETRPEITGDGLYMLVASDRPGGVGGHDIWMSSRASRSAAWSIPVRVPELSSAADDAGATPTDDKLAVVVSSQRDIVTGELYLSTRATTADAFGPLVRITNDMIEESSPMLSQDKLTVYFDVINGPGGPGGDDIYQLSRATTASAFGTIADFVPVAGLNTTADEGDVWISPDGRHAAFVSNRTIPTFYMIYEADR